MPSAFNIDLDMTSINAANNSLAKSKCDDDANRLLVDSARQNVREMTDVYGKC